MEHTRQGRGRKDKSRDALANMEARLAKVELAMADTREGEFMSFQDKVMTMFASVESRMEALAARMDARDREIHQEPAIYKTTVSPHTFNGKRDAKELDNFLWHMERYFEAIALTDKATKIPNMAEEELLFNFMDNLQSWVEQELRRHGVQDLATTMAVVESFVDYRRGDSSKPKPPSKGNQAKGKDKRKEFTPKTNCFLCDGPHWAWDCPKRKALNAMIEEKEQEGDAKVGSLQLLNALKAKLMPKMPQSKGLMYMEALVNGKATKALVDTGATHNFVSENEARRLELQASKEGGWLKAINSATKPSHGVARGMTMHIGSWEGRVDFIVAPMDDFKMVLRMDFLQRVKAVPLPFLRSMAILEEKKPCMVPTVTKGTLKTPMLSAMQVMKGLKRKEVTYLTTLKEERNDGSGEPMPKEIEGVLDEFKDMMPPELLKRFPPRMEEDHKIELESEPSPLL
uniref:Retrotransposon gag domain-containing protein n=1 Tax=Vitis vinifera TaxID=29760 RepID=A5B9K1_VITVI|nr:hypothetical protein VITISV_036524 [Vitis vinifera]